MLKGEHMAYSQNIKGKNTTSYGKISGILGIIEPTKDTAIKGGHKISCYPAEGKTLADVMKKLNRISSDKRESDTFTEYRINGRKIVIKEGGFSIFKDIDARIFVYLTEGDELYPEMKNRISVNSKTS
jgi:hypothetical protein